jgi:Cu+-exporting ATPase
MKTQITKINIAGMHCTSCARLVERSLRKTEGVEEVSVNYATKKAVVKYDANLAKISDLNQTVVDAGYTITQTEASDQADSLIWRRRFLISLVLTVPLFISMFVNIPDIFYIALVLTSLNLVIVARSFYQGFWSALKLQTFTMDSLIAIGTFSAFVFSLIMGTYHYFEVAASLITFVTLGKWLESMAKAKTSEAVAKLGKLSPQTAHLKTSLGIRDVSLSSVKSGDVLVVKPGEIVPLDGLIIDGFSSVDQSSITGESFPVDKKLDDKIFAGTQNLSGSFEFKVTADTSNTLLSRIIKLVDDAQSSRSSVQDLADKISSVFVPAVLIIALVTLIVWRFLLNAPWDESLLYFLAVIVIACPCALGLATPTVFMVATGLAAKYGLLIKGGDALEKSSQIKTIVFDKTGTLTQNNLTVAEFKNLSDLSDTEILKIAFSLEEKSSHPIALAIIKFCNSKKISKSLLVISNFLNLAGMGVSATINKHKYYVGKTDNHSVALKKDDKILASFALADSLRPDSLDTITRLQKKGFEIYLLTGDNLANAKNIATQLDIKPENIIADVLPDQKLEVVKKLQANLHSGGVAFVGDGVNDSPSLAQADLGVAIGTGTDIAVESGNVVIMNNKISSLISLFEIGSRSKNKINQNFGYALIYNLVLIPIAAGVLSPFGITLRPEFAALAMSLSSVSVVLNSLSLNRYRLMV